MPLSSRAEHALPAALAARADRTISQLDLPSALGSSPALRWVLALSTFAERVCQQQPAWIRAALERDAFASALVPEQLRSELDAAVAAAETLDDLQRCLRQARNRAQLQLVWRHLLGAASVEETTAALSFMADTFIDLTLARLTDWAEAEHGVPRDANGVAQRLTVLALGKLGAQELNLSSDVDLIYCYDAPGATDQGLSNDQFFTRLGQQMLVALDRLTADGFVFRVDLRLRPFGASGPLVMHREALLGYYQRDGRDWERYALQKARPCAGDLVTGRHLLRDLAPFVYRGYVDFGNLDALRAMKAAIVREHRSVDNIKLGPGGIRDVEFTIQALQLIWGGREPRLQTPRLAVAARALAELRLLPADEVAALIEAYRFFRDVEHSLQAFDDQQTQVLPADPERRLRVALSLGLDDVADFDQRLAGHRAVVRRTFDELIADPGSDGLAAPVPNPAAPTDQWQALDAARLVALGCVDVEETLAQVDRLVHAAGRLAPDSTGHQRLDALMPLLLREAAALPRTLAQQTMAATTDASQGLLRGLLNSSDAGVRLVDRALQRVVPLLVAILRRSAYLTLLLENPAALRRLLIILCASRWLATRLTQRPEFLDALLDERQQQSLPTLTELKRDLAARLEPLGDDDEHWFAELRAFKGQHHFNAALGQVRGTLPLMRTSDYLTFLAETVLAAASGRAWAAQPGWAAREAPFLVLGFGKLGGFELGPDSDLDLVLLHDLSVEQGPLLQRVARSFLSTIGTPTLSGPLYSVDTRLRPAGAAGTMVTQIDAFDRYQRERAWTWEHQALVRARPIVGDPQLAERFQDIRRLVLCRQRDPSVLRREVLAMHERLHQHFRSAPEDVKRSSGGIVDIEFLVQYLVLAHAHQHPQLITYTDNVRILEQAAVAGILSDQRAAALTGAYLALRTEGHRAVLDLPDAEQSAQVLAEHRELVATVWQSLFQEPLDAISNR